ncbi:acyl-CoA dehydrogenase family protein [Spongiibacter nanhainus]|uniref:Acyl-CoA dehydrogenase family protein n=1 Tax=Spongiibacter nanhainus TaxID=2794344 RepID=A0A7T4R330_9GAMM|nr:acyl-CoA dehydrogenase family protein [Spongiibacter nanhainus]QQD19584.1 acyl-CoA dehydrogenase family protein [Spongiibacter nanhainus]
MDFTFSEDQLLFQETVADFLRKEHTPERIRRSWEAGSEADSLWPQFVEMGLTALTVPEQFGGMGMSVLDFVLLAQEAGYVALAEPLVHNAVVATPLITAIGGELAEQVLPSIASGEAKVAVGLSANGLVEQADSATLLIMERDGKLYALSPESASLTANPSVDPGRKLFSVEFDAASVNCLADGARAAELIELAFNHGALANAAQALGLAQRMVDLSVAYTSERKQFGAPIGSFQAVKHHMANVAYQLEYARTPVYRAAYSLSTAHPRSAEHVSHAKLVACEVAELAAKNSIQVHGAMGYTWEVDLHIFMKRAWALAGSYGSAGLHKGRVAEAMLSDDAILGAAGTFA